jgi:Ca2+-transporting ATPase
MTVQTDTRPPVSRAVQLVLAVTRGCRRRPRGRPGHRAVGGDGGRTAAPRRPERAARGEAQAGLAAFIEQYRSYMQIILLVAAGVSFLIQEWSTAVLLILLTFVNAVVGLRQEGKAESAMNALKSMMKASARVKRDGVESKIPRSNWSPAIWC